MQGKLPPSLTQNESDHKSKIKKPKSQLSIIDVIGHIATYATLGTFNNLARINRQTYQEFKPLLNHAYKAMRDEACAQWLKLREREITDSKLSLELIPKELKKNKSFLLSVLESAMNLGYFTFIHYIVKEGVNLDTKYSVTFPNPNYRCTYVSFDRLGDKGPQGYYITSGNEYKVEHYYVLRNIVNKDSLNISRILYLLEIGVTLLNHEEFVIRFYDCALKILNNHTKYSPQKVASASDLLIHLFKKNKLNDLEVAAILRLSRVIKNPNIRRIETIFLIKKLLVILPSPFNFFADNRDSPLISEIIKQLKRLLLHRPVVDTEYIKRLEKIKNQLLENSQHPGEIVGNLFKELVRLHAQGIILFQDMNVSPVVPPLISGSFARSPVEEPAKMLNLG